MFEKSLYHLIRGLRNHKGTEKEYIQESLRECRKEIRGKDMDLKATALLKLTYLEMFGHDMSWASFHVLEVMSSPKFAQKKVGYLSAVQSFRPDTEVLMLAENLLKKDLNSPQPVTISLPLIALPHVINPPMANSLLQDLLTRLGHSHPAIRKKTIVTLYRLALVFPETLRPAWPKIKDRLLDENEDPSVTSAIINVVCELGWRRPQDFLPLAPRLFDLLVQGRNNWMAIKIIKLFATLTPLEPRLIKKLLPPLTTIIKTTPAMSLLYECIHGIIQGGILEGAEGSVEGEEIARLCVGKLRSMMAIEGDPNLKYVALLAFDKIVRSHPHLVSLHQDVILECIDDADISIRMRALDLAVGMVNSDNITAIVGLLMRQLRNAPLASSADDPANDRGMHGGVVPHAESDDEEAEESLRSSEKKSDQAPPLPDDYRISAIKRILEMCSRDTYANLNDFDWYIEVLVQLIRVCPAVKSTSGGDILDQPGYDNPLSRQDISCDIGRELQNVAVRVKSMRPEATQAAQTMIMIDRRDQLFPTFGNGGRGVLESAAWIIGEYSEYLTDPSGVMTSLLHSSVAQLPPRTLSIYIQAIPKVLSSLTASRQHSWTHERKATVSLLLARVVHFLEPLSTHSSLEVQERAVEYLELMRLAAEAVSSHEPGSAQGDFVDPPLLLTQAIPSLFMGMELNPVAPGAQSRVPQPDDLDLEKPINENLTNLLRQAEYESFTDQDEDDDVYRLYNEKFIPASEVPKAAADRLDQQESDHSSYQRNNDEEALSAEELERRKAERMERYKDDPFYIGAENRSGMSSPLHNIIKTSNGEDLDIDSIPIMNLDIDSSGAAGNQANAQARPKRKTKQNIVITADENLGAAEQVDAISPVGSFTRQSLAKKSLLQVDSSGLGSLSLSDAGTSRMSKLDIERKEAEDAEMAKALKEVERLRLEMQRASERIQAKNIPAEGTLVKRKKKKKTTSGATTSQISADQGEEPAASKGPVVKKKKKKPKVKETDEPGGNIQVPEESVAKPKRKKKRQVVFDEDDAG